MGKERYWAATSFKREGAETEAEAQTPSGCLCAFFQFFDFHTFHFSIQQQQPPLNSASCVPQDHTVPKGAEAPKNSLESEDGTISKAENLKIPKSIQFIKTSGSSRSGIVGNVNDLSPGTRTPTLVARLMGLDLLPDAQSPSSSSSSSSSSSFSSSSSYSCLSTQNNPQGNPNPNPNHPKPRQHIKTKPRHSTDNDNGIGIAIAASRSLPETPRISSARRSDVEHRLSLQINKENMGEELELPRFSFLKRKVEEQSSGRSPSQYARQIVKQVKESVSRKVGSDITNTVKHRESEQARGGEFVVQLIRSKKSARTSPVSKVVDDELSSPAGKHSDNPSCSPRLRFIDPKNKSSTTTTPKDQNSHPLTFSVQPQLSSSKPEALALTEQEVQQQKSSVPKCKKAANERVSSPRLKKPLHTSDSIRNKQDEAFVRPLSPSRPNDIKPKSKRKHPLMSPNLNLLTLKTDPSPPASKRPQKQVCCGEQEPKCSSQLSSGSRQRYEQEATSCRLATQESNNEDKSNGAGSIDTTASDGPEFQYVTGILSRTGLLVKGTTPTPTPTPTGTVTLSSNQWFSPTHPLDPSIFHHLEQHCCPTHPTTTSVFTVSCVDINAEDRISRSNNPLGLRCNRRLLFDLVDEILLGILGPDMEEEKGGKEHGGSQLAETVCESIGRFPSANCEVLEDIDALIEMEDMGKKKVLEEEGKGLVAEIEGNIMDTLVHETVMELECWSCGSVRKGRRRLSGSREET